MSTDPSCSSGRLGRAYNFFSLYSDIPSDYQYFGSKTFGGYKHADYCPVPRLFSNDTNLNYYAGSCSKLGDGNYGSFVYYLHREKYSARLVNYNNSYLEEITGEKYSDHSFCFLSSLTKKTVEKYNLFSEETRAVCFESFCSSKSLTVKVHENYIS